MLGFFGIPGRPARDDGGKTHIVHDGKPVCGTRLHPKSEFQWCSHSGTACEPECERCKRYYRQQTLDTEAERVLANPKLVADWISKGETTKEMALRCFAIARALRKKKSKQLRSKLV